MFCRIKYRTGVVLERGREPKSKLRRKDCDLVVATSVWYGRVQLVEY